MLKDVGAFAKLLFVGGGGDFTTYLAHCVPPDVESPYLSQGPRISRNDHNMLFPEIFLNKFDKVLVC